MEKNLNDPKGLVRESYNIDGLTEAECRSIFVDWALSRPLGGDDRAAMEALLETYSGLNPEHPMTMVLKEGLQAPAKSGRRGGRKARVANN